MPEVRSVPLAGRQVVQAEAVGGPQTTEGWSVETWIKEGLPLCLIGDSGTGTGTGTGKSHLLIALDAEAAMASFRGKDVLAPKLVNELVMGTGRTAHGLVPTDHA
ncbi:hypothetical protein [Streptomyces massasporeus]|uniref:hypothetical protein n=1 Tax=Streptomyces massasporeus TaxID=67324 RepID=UPI0036C235B1